MCGPSAAEENLSGQSASFASLLKGNYGTLFGQQQGVLNAINRSLSPILAAGPNQRGFSAQENAALQTQAINSAGAANRSAAQAVSNYGAARAGDSGLVSGIQRQLQASVASSSANQLATSQNQIAQADFSQGNANYWRAQGGMQALSEGYNPNASASAAISENQNAFGQAHEINQEKNQEFQTIAGGITSLAGMASGLPLPGLTENLGEAAGDIFRGGIGNLG